MRLVNWNCHVSLGINEMFRSAQYTHFCQTPPLMGSDDCTESQFTKQKCRSWPFTQFLTKTFFSNWFPTPTVDRCWHAWLFWQILIFHAIPSKLFSGRNLISNFNEDGGCKDHFSVHICPFHSISSKNIFGKFPSPYPTLHFMQFLTKHLDISFNSYKKFFRIDNHPTPPLEGGGSKHNFSVQIWTFRAIPSK